MFAASTLVPQKAHGKPHIPVLNDLRMQNRSRYQQKERAEQNAVQQGNQMRRRGRTSKRIGVTRFA
jgi:hypothetical protein